LEETSKKSDTRVNDIFFGPLERPVLQWLCARMPAWVNPDILTVIGVFGGFLIALGYWLSNYDRNFLWLSDFGLAVNWFGDSLDGSLARYRKIERFKYGYFVDHTVDTVTQTMICVGLGLSPFIDFNYAMLALVGYLQLGILTYVNTAVTGVFKISYGKIGPTEIRILIICINAVFYFASDPMFNLSFMKISFFNLIVLGVAAGFFLYFLIFAYRQGQEFARQDPPKSKVAG
jgi:archaetidylinositol phosphate synthase